MTLTRILAALSIVALSAFAVAAPAQARVPSPTSTPGVAKVLPAGWPSWSTKQVKRTAAPGAAHRLPWSAGQVKRTAAPGAAHRLPWSAGQVKRTAR